MKFGSKREGWGFEEELRSRVPHLLFIEFFE
jgi:hypothetical protein